MKKDKKNNKKLNFDKFKFKVDDKIEDDKLEDDKTELKIDVNDNIKDRFRNLKKFITLKVNEPHENNIFNTMKQHDKFLLNFMEKIKNDIKELKK
jgi:hypothetical protein